MRCKDEKKNYFGEFASSQLVKQYIEDGSSGKKNGKYFRSQLPQHSINLNIRWHNT